MNPETWRTYLVTQESASTGRTTLETVEMAIDGGVDAVQLREKRMDANARYDLGLRLREVTDDAGVALIVNDRIDLARAIDADGVHVGQSDLPVPTVHELVETGAIVGCSASTVEEAREAQRRGADYLGVGAVYGSESKDVGSRRDGIGPGRVEAISDAVSIPVLAIGGLTAENAGRVIEAGATGVAVISEIAAAEDPRAASERLAATVDRGRNRTNA